MRSDPGAAAAARMLHLMVLLLGGLAGTALQLQQRELLPPGLLKWMLAVAVATLAMWVLVPRWAAKRAALRAALRAVLRALGVLVLALAAAAAAFATVSLRAHARLAERLPAALEGRDIVVTGIVAQLPRASLQGTRFLFEVQQAALEGAGVAVVLPNTLSLAWSRNAEPDALLLGPAVDVRAGQRWRFTVRLRQPHGAFNPGGFDLELWLFERGIGATGQVRSRAGDNAVLLAEEAGAPVQRLRQRVRDAIERRVADPARAGVIAALAIGDQAAIEREEWDLFRTTGVAHLMSISGLHVTMFAWLAAAAIGWLWRRSPRAMLWLPSPRAARWGGVLLAAAYALVAGWGVPAQRTVWMLATVALLQTLARRWPLHLVLLVVAAVVVAVDPWAMLQPGFWLSFVAVALLVASEPVVATATNGTATATATATGAATPSPSLAAALPASLPSRALALTTGALRTQAIATVGLAPLTLLFFQQISLVGFAANLVAIPLVTLVITPLTLLGTLVPLLWDVAAFALGGLMAFLQALASGTQALLPAVWQAAAAPAWAVAAGLLGGTVAVLPLPWRLRALALPLMLPLLVPVVPRPAEGQFELVALDIGQGTAALVRTRHHLLVYDTGPAYGPEADAGSRLLVPLLRWRGERQVSLLMLSHRDTDHVGGAASLLAALPVRALSSSLADDHPLLARARALSTTSSPTRAAPVRCLAGQRWEWDGVHFEVLHPTAADYAVPGARPNAMSCVLRVASPEASVLLTGDVEAAQEAALVARAGTASTSVATAPTAATAATASATAPLRTQGMLVPHHGSRTSSTPAFIDAVAPQWALVQAGYRSRFGHPAPDVAARYTERGITLLRTDRCGALTQAPGGGGHLRCEREWARRYWHHRADLPAPG